MGEGADHVNAVETWAGCIEVEGEGRIRDPVGIMEATASRSVRRAPGNTSQEHTLVLPALVDAVWARPQGLL